MRLGQAKELAAYVTIPGNPLMATHRWGERLLTEANAKAEALGVLRIDCVHGVNCDFPCEKCVAHFAPARNPYGPSVVAVMSMTDDQLLAEYERRGMAERHLRKLANELDAYEKLAEAFCKPDTGSAYSFIEATLIEARRLAEGITLRQLAEAEKAANPLMMVAESTSSWWHNPTTGRLECVAPPTAAGIMLSRTAAHTSHQNTRDIRELGQGISRLPEPVTEGHYVLLEDLLCADE